MVIRTEYTKTLDEVRDYLQDAIYALVGAKVGANLFEQYEQGQFADISMQHLEDLGNSLEMAQFEVTKLLSEGVNFDKPVINNNK